MIIKGNIIRALLILLALSGCGVIPGKPGGYATPFPSTLAPETAAPPVIVTAGPAATSVPASQFTLQAGTPSPIQFPPGGGLIVGLQDQGRTVLMHSGDRFLLQLGEEFDWMITSSDDSVVERVIDVTVIRGAQGLYEGRKSGEATLNGVGDPKCRSSQPPCMAPSMIFTLHVRVEP
jgi:hypothetical protein